MSETTQPLSPRAQMLAARIDWAVQGVARHWLLIFNLLVALYLALPVAAPLLMHTGYSRAGYIIYRVFQTQCHQLPERSFFLFGQKATYSLQELATAGVLPGLEPHERWRFEGNDDFGYKIGFCQRDTATWAAILLAGLLFGLTRRCWRPLPLLWYALSWVPLALDGTTQLLGWRESNWLLRTLSGALIGLTTVWLAYPHVEQAMSDVLHSRERPAT